MPFDAALADRIRTLLARRKGVAEKKMFGGVCFLLRGNMLVGVWKEFLIARLGPEDGAHALTEPFVREMDITGKPMKGWVMVSPEGMEDDRTLAQWLERASAFVGTLPAK